MVLKLRISLRMLWPHAQDRVLKYVLIYVKKGSSYTPCSKWARVCHLILKYALRIFELPGPDHHFDIKLSYVTSHMCQRLIQVTDTSFILDFYMRWPLNNHSVSLNLPCARAFDLLPVVHYWVNKGLGIITSRQVIITWISYMTMFSPWRWP